MGPLIDIYDINMDKIVMIIREGISCGLNEYEISVKIGNYIHSIPTALNSGRIELSLLKEMLRALQNEKTERAAAFAEAMDIVEKGGI